MGRASADVATAVRAQTAAMAAIRTFFIFDFLAERGRRTATLFISNHKPQTFFAFRPAPYILSNIWSCLVHRAAKFRLHAGTV